jgi:hypothetical protein
MAAGCGSGCYLTYAPGNGETYRIGIIRGPRESERVDDVYQLDRMEIYLENMPCEVEIGWRVTIDEENWWVEKAMIYACVGAATVVRPRLTCPVEIKIYRIDLPHTCPGLPTPDLFQVALDSSWQHVETREVLDADAHVFQKRFKVWLEHVAPEQIKVGDKLRYSGHWYHVDSIGDMGSMTKLPWIEVTEMAAYNFPVEEP